MTIQQLKAKGLIIFECVAGSQAYNTAFPDSDEDVRGIFVQPTKEILAGRHIPQVSDKLNDIVYYEVGRFIELAAGANPNVVELLNMPEDCIRVATGKWYEYFPQKVLDKFVTKQLKNKFLGFATSQIKKAKGLNKMINWQETKVERKDVLDFCYVMVDREESAKFKHWKRSFEMYTPGILNFAPVKVSERDLCLAKVNNMSEIYSMYYMPNNKGMIGDDSNQLRLSSIPKNAPHIGYLRWDISAWSQHCKDYRTYQTWIKERNPQRYDHNKNHGQGFDGKNLSHMVRLLNMASEIAQGRGIIVRRPDAEYLKNIRLGKVDLAEIYDTAEERMQLIREMFEKSDLPKEFPLKDKQELLLKIRLDNL